LTILDARPVADGPGWWLRFRELRDRAQAEALRDVYLEADVARESLAPGESWWHEVVGTAVVDATGSPLGTVADVYRAGGAEVLVVRDGPLGELDVPNVSSVVREFAPRAGRIVVDVVALDPELPAARRPRGRRSRRAADAAERRGPTDEAGA
jgi:ribosomal 30S subunit maturation factor RimM